MSENQFWAIVNGCGTIIILSLICFGFHGCDNHKEMLLKCLEKHSPVECNLINR